MDLKNNLTLLQGTASAEPLFSHESYGQMFYQLPLAVARNSGTVDTLRIIVCNKLLETCPATVGGSYAVSGEIRTYNQPEGVPRTIVACYARTLATGQDQSVNQVHVNGVICKPPIYRTTPLGREICDMIVAVSRDYRRTDYLPCVCWGSTARTASQLTVGTPLTLTGRFQSRTYAKLIGGEEQTRTAYEISVLDLMAQEHPLAPSPETEPTQEADSAQQAQD